MVWKWGYEVHWFIVILTSNPNQKLELQVYSIDSILQTENELTSHSGFDLIFFALAEFRVRNLDSIRVCCESEIESKQIMKLLITNPSWVCSAGHSALRK